MEILICNLAKCWGPSSVANRTGARSMCTVLTRNLLGFVQMRRAPDPWLSSREHGRAAGGGQGSTAASWQRGPLQQAGNHRRGWRRGAAGLLQRFGARSALVYSGSWRVVIRGNRLSWVILLFTACLCVKESAQPLVTHTPPSTALPEDQKHPFLLEPTGQSKLVAAMHWQGLGHQAEQGNTRFYMDQTK